MMSLRFMPLCSPATVPSVAFFQTAQSRSSCVRKLAVSGCSNKRELSLAPDLRGVPHYSRSCLFAKKGGERERESAYWPWRSVEKTVLTKEEVGDGSADGSEDAFEDEDLLETTISCGRPAAAQ